MNRRTLLKSAWGLPAAAALPGGGNAQTSETSAKLKFDSPDTVAQSLPRFFSKPEMASFERLGRVLMPAAESAPGAAEAEAASFLDFLLSQSRADRQAVYRTGLRSLDGAAQRRFGKTFADLSDPDAAELLSPLWQPWSGKLPADPLARFLVAAKDDFWQATLNSRQHAEALSGRRRAASGLGLYWHASE
ncbi:MAG: gluconate 2-dehydrogenase subunit 3 family protein [Bryobacteraceae bacterium]